MKRFFSSKKITTTGYEWVNNMPNLIFHNAVHDSSEMADVTSKIEAMEIAERDARNEQDRILSFKELSFKELECSGNLIMREWLERDERSVERSSSSGSFSFKDKN